MAKQKGFNYSFLLTFIAILGLFGLYQRFLAPVPCANSISCIKDLSGEYQDAEEAIFMGKKFTSPAKQLIAKDSPVLGERTGGEKRIYVDLTEQRLYAFEGDSLIFQFPVSTGKWYYTPTGEFKIWIKLRYTLMTGGSQANGTYYYLPNVPYTMYFYNDEHPKTAGFGIHGAYWHINFGHPMSHGCINMLTEDVEKLYKWADPLAIEHTTYASAEHPGTPITIYGETPIVD